jgi:hypothetical protein
MKLVIQHVEECADGEIPARRDLGQLELSRKDIGEVEAFAISDAPVHVDAEHWMVVHGAYVPWNHALSVMIGYHSATSMQHVFSAMGWWEHSPGGKSVYYAFYLPAGQFIELYFLPDDRPAKPATSGARPS